MKFIVFHSCLLLFAREYQEHLQLPVKILSRQEFLLHTARPVKPWTLPNRRKFTILLHVALLVITGLDRNLGFFYHFVAYRT